MAADADADADDLDAVAAAEDVKVDASIRSQVVSARPELDPVARAVMRASAAAALFGPRAAVTIGRYQLVREVGTGGGGIVFLATDPELDRPVAVKLISAGDDTVRARAVAEGQALAKLSNPHVVHVYDVGIVDDRVYLVMELVQGESLRAYAERATVRDVIRAYRQAADGLLAAHGAGLVHRDFKPDNAMRGSDGRVRVVDFGLAGAEGDAARGGTPHYMAPEQQHGGTATAAADQYAFAVSLGEAAARAGGYPLPRWLDAIVTRGSATDPAARFPSLADLLRALDNDPRARWRRRALIAVPLAIGAVGFAVGRGGDDAPAAPRCDQGAAAIAPAWTAARAAAADAHVVGLGTPYAADNAPRVRTALADYATGWTRGFDAACVAAKREPSATVVAHRSACLASARTQLGAAVDLVTRVTSADLGGAVQALAELPDLARCADAAALVTDIPPPTAAQAAEADAITADLDRARVDIDAALPSAPDRVERLVARARTLDYRPLLAVALLAQGRALMAADRMDRAVAPFAEAGAIAIEVRDDVTAVEAYARLAMARSEGAERADLTLAGIAPIEPLAARLGDREPFVRALLHNHIGVIENASGDRDRARKELRIALALARAIKGPGAVELAWVRTNLAMLVDDPGEQSALRNEAVAVARDRLGPDHPLTLKMQLAAAFGIADVDPARAGMRPPCETMARQHPTRAASIVDCGYELAILDLAAGAEDDAGKSFALVVDATAGGPVAGVSPDDPRIAVASGYAAMFTGDAARASTLFAGFVARIKTDTPWYELIYFADAELGLAALAQRRGDHRAERAAVDRAIGYLDRALATNPLLVVERRAGWARAWRARLTTNR